MREAESTTLAEALDRYLSEVTSTKKGAKQEQVRIKKWKEHKLASKRLAAIRSSDMACVSRCRAQGRQVDGYRPP